MSSYTSIGAYRIALMIRGSKTVLVEGDTDACMLNRLILEQNLAGASCAGGRPVVDRVALVKDESLTGLGNRSRVLALSEAMNTLPNKFRGFVDKEWHGYDFLDFGGCDFLDCETISNVVLLTKGHSIENYFFDPDFYREFILRNFGDRLSRDYFDLIPRIVEDALLIAFAISAGAKKARLIERCNGLNFMDVMEWDGVKFSIDIDVLIDALRARNATEEKCQEFRSEFERVSSVTQEGDVEKVLARWAAHGHIGDAVIWSALAKLALLHGVRPEDANQIQDGKKREKFADGAHFVARRPEEERAPLDRLLSWALNPG